MSHQTYVRAFTTALVVAFVVLSGLAGGAAPTRRVTGSVTELHSGEWLSVANEMTDPMGYKISLRDTTSYEGPGQNSAFDPAALKPGARVTVWWRGVGERRFVADKVRVLGER